MSAADPLSARRVGLLILAACVLLPLLGAGLAGCELAPIFRFPPPLELSENPRNSWITVVVMGVGGAVALPWVRRWRASPTRPVRATLVGLRNADARATLAACPLAWNAPWPSHWLNPAPPPKKTSSASPPWYNQIGHQQHARVCHLIRDKLLHASIVKSVMLFVTRWKAGAGRQVGRCTPAA